MSRLFRRRLAHRICAVLALAGTPVLIATASSARAGAAGPSAANYSAVVLADHPDIYWRLGEASGITAFDSSGKGRDGTYRGDPTLGVDGAIKGDPDTAVKFDGVDDGVSWQPKRRHEYRGPFTVEAWIRSNRGTGEQAFFSARGPRDYSFDIKLSDFDRHGIRVDVGNGHQWYVTETIAFDWQRLTNYYVAAVATLVDVTVYVNGVPIGTVAYPCDSCEAPLFSSHSHIVQVGENGAFNEWFAGRIDEPAVYRYALSGEQVAAHYAAGK